MRLHKTVCRLGLAGAAALALTSTAAQAQGEPPAPIVIRAERCLRQNVDRVVAADHDMQSAATFLVTYACASEVEGARRYERNSAYVQMFSLMFKGIAQSQVPIPIPGGAKPPMPAGVKPPSALADFKASVDPETGLIVLPPSAPGAPPNPMAAVMPMMESLFSQVAPDNVPVSLRKLAGDLVLAAHAKAH